MEDSGVGISADAQEKLFQVFTQADSSVTRKFGGTGLGLAISKALVEGMGGKIGFRSAALRGTTFWFELPLETGQRRTDEPVVVRKFGTPANPLTVLLAEDNEVNQLVASCYLQAAGFTVTAVENGVQAYEAVGKRPFDLILMDCQMPEMDGYRATEKIRGLPVPWASTIPIIALTANAVTGDREQCLASGMNDYVTKPIDKTQLLEVIYRHLVTRLSGNAKKAA